MNKKSKSISKKKQNIKTQVYSYKNTQNQDLIEKFNKIRQVTIDLCKNLVTEDYVLQPCVDASPPKWHLAHTSWFFETFILTPHQKGYKLFHPLYSFFFNSYYNAVGNRTKRNERGLLSRPTVTEIQQYRQYIDAATIAFLQKNILSSTLRYSFILGLQHEQQHQELLLTDMKLALSYNPLHPKVNNIKENQSIDGQTKWLKVKEGLYEVGHEGEGFCFDNEVGRHKVYLYSFEIASQLVTNGDYLEFIKVGGYKETQYWHYDGWAWLQNNPQDHPQYWQIVNGEWYVYTLNGLVKLNMKAPVTHVNFYEASAYAEFRKMRLATEFEWEIGATMFKWGDRWEWTNSAYLPYPGFTKADGAIGEYNGKFMVNQMVLRGSSIATSKDHERITYRNFFHPHLTWQFTGIRLVRDSK